jgi:hypothetical protein
LTGDEISAASASVEITPHSELMMNYLWQSSEIDRRWNLCSVEITTQ